jgi:putative oxidoreductase
MLRKIFATENSSNWLLLRVALGTVMLAHGLQKMFGWFGGFGWANTMSYFTDHVGLPSPIAAMVILIESVGALFLIIGLAGRLNAFLMLVVIFGAFFVDHLPNGFFMNWFGNQKGEGFEFDILFAAIAFILCINGSGSLSIDRMIAKRMEQRQKEGSLKWAKA